jgi:hypothetical protein
MRMLQYNNFVNKYAFFLNRYQYFKKRNKYRSYNKLYSVSFYSTLVLGTGYLHSDSIIFSTLRNRALKTKKNYTKDTMGS